jgi:hypothetical protein
MKKRDKEELISKSVVFTVIILAIMFCTMLIQNAYFKIPPTAMSLATPTIVLVTSILSLVVAVVFVVFGFIKSQKYFEVSAWAAGLATFLMLLKINYEVKALEFKLPSNFFVLPNTMIKFYAVAMAVMVLAIVIMWVRTLIKVLAK